MPSDFFVFYKVSIQYKKGDNIEVKEHVLETTREGYIWWECEREKDEEINDFYDRKHEQKEYQVNRELEEYPRKDIFKNGGWLCNDTSKEAYMNIAKKYDIPSSSIISIWKEGDFLVK